MMRKIVPLASVVATSRRPASASPSLLAGKPSVVQMLTDVAPARPERACLATSSIFTIARPFLSWPVITRLTLSAMRSLLKLPVLIPGRLGADALARHRHVDQVRPVFARDLLHAPSQRGLQLLRARHALALDALRAREPDVIHRRRAEPQPGILVLAEHLGVRHVLVPVVAHDLVALVVRHHREDRGVVAGHRPEAGRAVVVRAVELSWTTTVLLGSTSASWASSTLGCTPGSCSCSRTRFSSRSIRSLAN